VSDAASAEAEAAEAEEDDEPAPPPPPTKGKGAKKAASKLTPMEKQVIEIKRQNMNTVLVIEVGYKFRFFGEDARTAAKELGIVCIPGKFRFDEREYLLHAIPKIY
jgi:Mismatch repair ATPase (MutS family)